MQYAEHSPSFDLAPFIDSFWSFKSGPAKQHDQVHTIVPDGAVSISLILLPQGEIGIGMAGPALTAHQTLLIPDTQYCGIRLRPGVAGSLIKTDIQHFRSHFGPLINASPTTFDLVQSVAKNGFTQGNYLPTLEQVARALINEADNVDDIVRQLADQIMANHGSDPLYRLMENFDLGPRQIRRRFKYQCGLSPKEFARLRRVREACVQLLKSGIRRDAFIALDTGFADQAHMSRELKQVFGNSPKLVSQYLKQIDHGDLLSK